ncbi:MAG: DUF4124 domain-containing protein [Gammaproteobacteria bacterium]|nr:DUF4124 domain-containing protein [Gammaproteobacteria bacterium]
MKTILLYSLFVLAFFYAFTASATLYKGLDADGNTVYSDTPFEDAEKFTPPSISVVDAPGEAADKKPVEDDKPAEFKYMSFDIISPTNNQTIHNNPDIIVTLNLKPGLNTEKNHSIWLLVDGKPVVKNAQSLALQIGRLERGAYSLQAQVRDEDGKEVVKTRAVVIFVKQASVR